MPCVGIVGLADRLVGFSETNEIRCNNAKTGIPQRRDHMAIQVRPARLAMQQQYGGAVCSTFVDVMHLQPADIGVMGSKVVTRQVFES